jgi:hypothetical protein
VDWTIGTHHFLVEDLHYCTLCGRCPEVLYQVLLRLGDLGVAAVYCLGCRNGDAQMQRLRDLLEQRYGAGGERP